MFMIDGLLQSASDKNAKIYFYTSHRLIKARWFSEKESNK